MTLTKDQTTLILDTMAMRLTANEAVVYLDSHGYHITYGTYNQHRRRLKAKARQRVYSIAENYEALVMDKLDTINTCISHAWKTFFEAKPGSYAKIKALEEIRNQLITKSAYESQVKIVIESNTASGNKSQESVGNIYQQQNGNATDNKLT